MQRQIVVLLSLMLLASCGDDNPVAPADKLDENLDKNLVGSWVFDSTDFIDTMAAGMTEFMRDEGVSQDVIRTTIAEFRTEVSGVSEMFRLTVRFNADGSYEDDQGGRGTWWVEGNILIQVENGEEGRIRYFVDGDDLTFIFDFEFLMDSLREDGDLTDEELVLIRDILDEDVKIRLFFKRK